MNSQAVRRGIGCPRELSTPLDGPRRHKRHQLFHIKRFEQTEAEHLRHLLEGMVLFNDSFQAREGVVQFELGDGRQRIGPRGGVKVGQAGEENIQHPTSNIEHPMPAICAINGCWALGVGSWMFPGFMGRVPFRADEWKSVASSRFHGSECVILRKRTVPANR